MKNKIIIIIFITVLAVTGYKLQAQMYRASSTEALENDGKEWIEKKLPSSLITFSDYSGQVEIKTLITSLVAQPLDSTIETGVYADFTMQLDKSQIPEQIAAGKNFTSTGLLTINNISKKISARYTIEPRNYMANGFGISVIIRFNPADFDMKLAGETENTSLIVRVTGGYINKLQNNF